MENGLEVRIRRSDGPGDRGRYDTFVVERQRRSSVLDVLGMIQTTQDPTLAYRYSCRAGMCGTCSMRVNGRNRWTCRTSIGSLGEGTLTLEPLPNYPVIRDLVVDMRPFFDAHEKVLPRFVPADRAADFARIPSDSKERRDIDAHVECITCGICFGSCGIVASNEAYVGPAALMRVYTLVRDSRDGARDQRLRHLGNHDGVWGCHTQFNCSDSCPMDLEPTRAIQKLKRLVTRHALARLF
jgi:succinate dehydrogenase/fumarate reductase iron-sulfur protein